MKNGYLSVLFAKYIGAIHGGIKVNDNVTKDRDKFFGGSDVPAIMGLSPFKTRYQLLLEKACLCDDRFNGNAFTEYGTKMEEKIRAYINTCYGTCFKPNTTIAGDIRCNTDGYDGECVLEIKTTSQIHGDVNDYKAYLVQLLLYMDINKVEFGLLAVYHRPDDFNEELNPKRLQEFPVKKSEHAELLKLIYYEIDRFRADLERLKENPLLSEEDLQPTELIELSNKVLGMEQQLQAFKALEKQYKEMKQQLYESMVEHNVKKWTTLNDVQITRVDGTPSTLKTVSVFNEARFKKEHPELYNEYLEEQAKEKSGRAGYVKITLPKM
jgi:putative phage-type endonuclease